MVAAVLVSFLYIFTLDAAAAPHLLVNLGLVLVALAIGGVGAWFVGRKVAMTAMPQMVAIYNGMGGGAAGGIAAVELFGSRAQGTTQLVVTLLGALIGAVSMSGSVIAWAKLQGVLGKPLRFSGQRILNGLVFLAALGVGGWIVFVTLGGVTPVLPVANWITIFFGVALLFGILMTLPIGGADMPVVISIYNAFTGLAVGFEGYVLGNPALMIAGMVVGAAGLLLTLLMAKAMNRSVANVLFSNFGVAPAKGKHGAITGTERETQASDAAIKMRYASSVIIVPGYGLAAAQGQQKLYEFVKLLLAAKVQVRFAIHPVAGRMPGQMDVLLAEAGVPYDLIFQLDDDQRRFREHRHRSGDRRQRCGQPGRAHRQILADLRHADPRRRQGQAGLRDQARPGKRLFRHRQRAVLRTQLQHGLRRCAGRAGQDDRGREGTWIRRRLIKDEAILPGASPGKGSDHVHQEDAGRRCHGVQEAAGDPGMGYPHARPGTDPGEDRGLWRLPYRPARR